MIDKNTDNSWPLLYCHIEQTTVMLQSALTMNFIDIAWDNMILPQFRYYEIRSDSWLKWKSLILEAWLQNMFPSIRFGEVCLFCFFQGRVTAVTLAIWGIVKQTEAKLRLRGVGSGYFEAPSHEKQQWPMCPKGSKCWFLLWQPYLNWSHWGCLVCDLADGCARGSASWLQLFDSWLVWWEIQEYGWAIWLSTHFSTKVWILVDS